MLNRKFTLIISGLFVLFLSSCGNGDNDRQNNNTDTTSATSSANDTGKLDDLTQFKYDKLISNVPIPFDILRVHSEVPLTYTAEAVNPTFGGWIVLAGPIWSGAIIAAGFLLFQTHRARTAQRKTKG